MADGVLDLGLEFRHGRVELRDEEDWVIAETTFSPLFVKDLA